MNLIKLFNIVLTRFYSPDDLGAIGNPFSSDQAILDEVEKETKDVVDKDLETKDEKIEKDEVEDDKVDDDDTKEDDDDKKDKTEDESDEDAEEEKEASSRITQYTDIKKEFPEFFKKFPDIRAALFRDQRYGEIFGSVDDAEEAVKKANSLDEMEQDIIINGNPENLLKIIHKNSKESFDKFALDILPQIQELDKDLYLELAAVPIKQMLRAAWKQGKGKETDLGRAAAYIHNFFFDNLDIDKSVKGENVKKTEKSQREIELEKKLQDIDTREYNSFQNSVNQSYVDQMTAEVGKGLASDERITSYMKGKIIEDILADIKNNLTSDTRYMNQMGSLWKQAKAAKFSNDFKSRLINTALARAKSLIPATRQKVVSSALKVEKKKDDKKEDNQDKSNRREFTPRDKSKDKSSKREEPLTDRDILRSA